MVVAPLVGVWIEIVSHAFQTVSAKKSLPSWECGLKYDMLIKLPEYAEGRSPRGSVD